MPKLQSKNNRKVTDFFQPARKVPATMTTAEPPLLPAELSSSSLSSPPSTPTPTPTPQPSAKKKGHSRVVPSSDGEESSDDSDLEDPFGLFTNIPAPAVRKSVLKGDDTSSPKVSMQIANYTSTIPNLLKQREDEKALKQRLELAYSLIEECERKDKEPRFDPQAVLSEDTAQEVMGKDGSGAKLLQALGRGDTWGVNTAFFEFFDHKMSTSKRKPFPVEAVKDSPLCTLLEDSTVREQMFLSGIFTDDDLSPHLALPEEVLLWILDEVCLEDREDMVHAYSKILLARQNHLVLLMSVGRITSLLENFGAFPLALDLERRLQFGRTNEMDPKFGTGVQYWRFWNIVHVIGILGQVGEWCAKGGDSQRTQFICGNLIRMALDDQLSRQSNFIAAVEQALHCILRNIPDDMFKAIGYSIMSTIHKPQARVRVLNILPMYSQELHLFRRRLACTFLFEDASHLTRDKSTLVDLDRISTLLGESQFKISQNTDYAELHSLIRIVDIAVDNGASSGIPGEPDKAVDRLVELLRVMFTRIVDTNARDLARTVTKDAIERLQFRLTFAVRTKRRQALGLSDGNQRTLASWMTKQ